jgi:hypothetical protein
MNFEKIVLKITRYSFIIFLYFAAGVFFVNVSTQGTLSNYRISKVIVAPIESLELMLGRAKRNGLMNIFRSDKVVPRQKREINQLETDLYVLHANANSNGIDYLNLRTGVRIKLIDFSGVSGIKGKPNDRHMVCVDTTNRSIIVSPHPSNILFIFDYHGELDKRLEFDFLIHHRIASFNGMIYVNTRREIDLGSGTIDDEGYAVINPNGEVIHEFWLSEHLEEVDAIVPLNELCSFVSVSRDPFHINDVEYVDRNFSDSSKIQKHDVLLSSRHLNAILLVRNNKVVNVFTGSFRLQHDVDIISDSVLTVFNNNSTAKFVGLRDPKSNILHLNIYSGEEKIVHQNFNMKSKNEGQYQRLKSGIEIIENQNENELIVIDEVGNLVYRGGIRYVNDSNFNELLTWAPVFDQDILKLNN